MLQDKVTEAEASKSCHSYQRRQCLRDEILLTCHASHLDKILAETSLAEAEAKIQQQATALAEALARIQVQGNVNAGDADESSQIDRPKPLTKGGRIPIQAAMGLDGQDELYGNIQVSRNSVSLESCHLQVIFEPSHTPPCTLTILEICTCPCSHVWHRLEAGLPAPIRRQPVQTLSRGAFPLVIRAKERYPHPTVHLQGAQGISYVEAVQERLGYS